MKTNEMTCVGGPLDGVRLDAYRNSKGNWKTIRKAWGYRKQLLRLNGGKMAITVLLHKSVSLEDAPELIVEAYKQPHDPTLLLDEALDVLVRCRIDIVNDGREEFPRLDKLIQDLSGRHVDDMVEEYYEDNCSGYKEEMESVCEPVGCVYGRQR